MAIILPVLKGLCQDVLNHFFATCKITLFLLIFASIKFYDFKKFEKFNTRKQKIAPNLIPLSKTKQEEFLKCSESGCFLNCAHLLNISSCVLKGLCHGSPDHFV